MDHLSWPAGLEPNRGDLTVGADPISRPAARLPMSEGPWRFML